MDQMSIFDMEPVNLTMGPSGLSKDGCRQRTRFLGGVATAMLAFGGAHGGLRDKVLRPSYLVCFVTRVSRRRRLFPPPQMSLADAICAQIAEDEGPATTYGLRFASIAFATVPASRLAQLGSL